MPILGKIGTLLKIMAESLNPAAGRANAVIGAMNETNLLATTGAKLNASIP